MNGDKKYLYKYRDAKGFKKSKPKIKFGWTPEDMERNLITVALDISYRPKPRIYKPNYNTGFNRKFKTKILNKLKHHGQVINAIL